MQRLDVPEQAIQAFEKIHDLQVTIHDLRGSLSSAISRDRSHHSHPLCHCVKAAGGNLRCTMFEVLQLRANIHLFAEGRYHLCHAGLVEWVMPVCDQLELEWVLFAGVRTPGPNLSLVHREPITRWKRSPWQSRVALPPPVDEEEAGLILEHLRQLASRLYSWAHEKKPNTESPPWKDTLTENNLVIRRRTLIRRYIESHQGRNIRLRDLAAQLKVSDRATHLIRECCGQTFREMLIDARLKTAKELLRFSSLPVLEVALSSGFNEISHFNRLFRQRSGCAPNQYRRKSSA
jgi:AraC-like DNA-binding protein